MHLSSSPLRAINPPWPSGINPPPVGRPGSGASPPRPSQQPHSRKTARSLGRAEGFPRSFRATVRTLNEIHDPGWADRLSSAGATRAVADPTATQEKALSRILDSATRMGVPPLAKSSKPEGWREWLKQRKAMNIGTMPAGSMPREYSQRAPHPEHAEQRV